MKKVLFRIIDHHFAASMIVVALVVMYLQRYSRAGEGTFIAYMCNGDIMKWALRPFFAESKTLLIGLFSNGFFQNFELATAVILSFFVKEKSLRLIVVAYTFVIGLLLFVCRCST